ncbi:MAG: hypothetical protein GY757_23040 [bacterium]|nr:hypothetical protein [bacterium]
MKQVIIFVMVLVFSAVGFTAEIIVAKSSGDYSTIQAGLNAASAGDTVTVRAGVYYEKITIPSSGSASSGYITLQAYSGESVIIDGTGVSGSNMIYMENKNYIKITGFEIRNNLGVSDGSGIRVEGYGAHLEFRDCEIHTIRGSDAMGITVYGTSATAISDLVIDGNEIYNCDPAHSEALTLNGNVNGFSVTNNIVHDVNNIAIDFIGGESWTGNHGVARNGVCSDNTVYNARSSYGGGYAGGIYVDGGQDIVIERNRVYSCDMGIEVGAENSGVNSTGITVRSNLIYNNDKVGIVFGGYESSAGRVNNCSFYNNTLYKNDTLQDGNGELWIQYGSNNTIKNNICYCGSQNLLLVSATSDASNTLDYNMWYSTAGTSGVTFNWGGTEYTSWQSYLNGTGQDAHSLFAVPLFVDGVNRDYHLQLTSTAIDAGDPAYSGSGVSDIDSQARVLNGRVDIGADEIGSPTVTAPNGGESWPVGSSHNITWSSSESNDNITIQLSTNNGSSWSTITQSTSNDGSYSWTVPDSPSTTCLVSVEYAANGNFSDSSDAVFAITSSSSDSISVSSPNGGESWIAGSSHAITWSSTGTVGNVKIEYSTNSGSSWTTVVSSTANDGTYSWTVPNAVSSTCMVRVSESDGSPGDSSDGFFSIVSPDSPVISLDRSQLNYAASGSDYTGSQNVLVFNSGGGSLNWSAACDESWLSCSPSSGSGSFQIAVSVNPSGLTAGTYTGAVTISAPNASNSSQSVSVTFSVLSSSAEPFGQFSTPLQGSTVSSSIPVTGWVLDDIEVVGVKIYRDDNGELRFIGDALLVEGARADVEQSYPDYPLNYLAGWGYMMLTNFLPGGNGVFTIYAIATDKEGNATTLGSKTITVDNANAVKPFGAIDTPAAGGDASGTSFRNAGWVLTPPPSTVPEDGSTIFVYLDGVPLGNPVYGEYRDDIAGLFPGYNNSDGALAYFDFDTTGYANGVHTIYWIATDDNDNSDGIGSRFFNIRNTGGIVQNKRCTIEGADGAVSSVEPVFVIKRSGKKIESQSFVPDTGGVIEIDSGVVERIEIHLAGDHIIDRIPLNTRLLKLENGYSGYLEVGTFRRCLPIGSTLDMNRGIFYWLPGPGFLGAYKFVFIDNARNTRRVIKITLSQRQ